MPTYDETYADYRITVQSMITALDWAVQLHRPLATVFDRHAAYRAFVTMPANTEFAEGTRERINMFLNSPVEVGEKLDTLAAQAFDHQFRQRAAAAAARAQFVGEARALGIIKE